MWMWIFNCPIAMDFEQGLWGGSLCIQWLPNWLNILVAIWSLKNKSRCYLVNEDANPNPYFILFHDINIDCGHYEPLLYKISSMLNLDQCNHYLSQFCKYLQNYWKSIVHELQLHQCDREITTTCIQSLRLHILQTFWNAIINKHKDELNCLKIYLIEHDIQDQPMARNWQSYMINMEMPYKKEKLRVDHLVCNGHQSYSK